MCATEEEIEISPDTEEDPTTQKQTQTQNREGQSKTQTSTQGTQEGSHQNENPDLSNLCKFHRNGDCKFGAKSQQNTQNSAGNLSKTDTKDSKCRKIHLNACKT